MGILHTNFASGNMLTAGSTYGDTGTSGLNEFTNRVNVMSGALFTDEATLVTVSGADYTDKLALVGVSGAGYTTSGAGYTTKQAGLNLSGALASGLPQRTLFNAYPGSLVWGMDQLSITGLHFTPRGNGSVVIQGIVSFGTSGAGAYMSGGNTMWGDVVISDGFGIANALASGTRWHLKEYEVNTVSVMWIGSMRATEHHIMISMFFTGTSAADNLYVEPYSSMMAFQLLG